MTYKYHERAIVINERNMHRVWDVAYDGYNAGKGLSVMDWTETDIKEFKEQQQDTGSDFDGKDIVVVPLTMTCTTLPSPMPYQMFTEESIPQFVTSDLMTHDLKNFTDRFLQKTNFDDAAKTNFKDTMSAVNSKINIVSSLTNNNSASSGATSNEATTCRMFYQGSVKYTLGAGNHTEITGCGHHGPDYPGVASVRNGKSLMQSAAPGLRYLPAPAPAPA
tara:strand:- start:168 stop:827 length:660 start_codon:yes stop_codon:yes gene_type:complete